MLEIEVWVLVDENGDYGVGRDADGSAQNYADDVGVNDPDAMPKRLVKVVLSVPKPCEVVLRGTVPAEGEASLSVA